MMKLNPPLYGLIFDDEFEVARLSSGQVIANVVKFISSIHSKSFKLELLWILKGLIIRYGIYGHIEAFSESFSDIFEFTVPVFLRADFRDSS